MTFDDDPRRTDILAPHTEFVPPHPDPPRRQAVASSPGPVFDPMHDPARVWFVTEADLIASGVVCPSCGRSSDTIGFRDRPNDHRMPSFVNLEPEIARVLKAQWQNRANRARGATESGTLCPRCRFLDAVPWSRLAWSNLSPLAIGKNPKHLKARLAVDGRQNEMMAVLPTVAGALFDAGRLALALDVEPLLATPQPQPESRYAAPACRTNAGLPFGKSFLARHLVGDFGLVGSYRHDLVNDPAQGMLASQLTRNVRAIASQPQRGEIVSRFAVGSHVPTANGAAVPQLNITVWTVFGACASETLTAIMKEPVPATPTPSPRRSA